MKQKTKKVLIWTLKRIPFFTFMLVCSFLLPYIIGASTIAFVSFMRNPVKQFSVAEVNVARAKEVEEMPIRLWALNYAYEQGLEVNKFDCVVNAESRWNENAYNINKNGTVDLGLMQWNSQHIKSGFISLECVSEPKCAVKRAVEKIKADKGYKAWYGVKNCN